MSKEELSLMKVDVLTNICKEKGIHVYHGKKKFTKKEMIEAISNVQSHTDVEAPVQVKNDIENVSVVVKEKEAADKQSIKGKYLDNISIGTLVAFREDSGKLNTAAVQNVSYKRKQLKLITQYNKEYIIPFANIVWIRTKKRWPSFVMQELKQKGGNNEAKQ